MQVPRRARRARYAEGTVSLNDPATSLMSSYTSLIATIPNTKMTQDAPSHHDNLQTNGSTKLAAASDAPYILPEICNELRSKVISFLDETTDDKVLRNVQSQVRVSMKVIEDAISRYG